MEDDSQSSSDDWIAGATFEAEAQNLTFGGICLSFEGLDMPEPEETPVS